MNPLGTSNKPAITLQAGSHVPALDGLRGIAVGAVLLFHTGVFPGGFLGVDLFFVLSGFLITGLLLREARRSGVVSILGFWQRRARRLLPALVLLLTVVTVIVWLVAPADLVRTTLADGPWVQASLQNWHLLIESANYWARFGNERVFEHLWSISLEEQFYVIWPLAVLAVVAARRRNSDSEMAVLIVAGALAALSALAMLTQFDPLDATRAYTGTDTRAFALLIGACAACSPAQDAIIRMPERAKMYLGAIAAFAVAAIWIAATGPDSSWLFRGGFAIHAAGAATIIAIVAQRPSSTAARLLGIAPLRWIGSISYGLYLWHWPVIVGVRFLAPDLPVLVATILVAAVSVILSAASRYLVEDPIRHRARWARTRTGFFVFTAAMIFLAALWWVLPSPPVARIDVTHLN